MFDKHNKFFVTGLNLVCSALILQRYCIFELKE